MKLGGQCVVFSYRRSSAAGTVLVTLTALRDDKAESFCRHNRGVRSKIYTNWISTFENVEKKCISMMLLCTLLISFKQRRFYIVCSRQTVACDCHYLHFIVIHLINRDCTYYLCNRDKCEWMSDDTVRLRRLKWNTCGLTHQKTPAACNSSCFISRLLWTIPVCH